MISSLVLMAGADIPIPECQLIIHQPTLREIAFIGESDFFIGVQCLTVSKNLIPEGETILQNTSNFQVFMTIMTEQTTADKKAIVMTLLQILFPKYKISFLPNSLMFLPIGENNPIIVEENNFEYLQEVIKQICCLNSNLQDSSSFNPVNAAASQIAQKLARGRQRVAAQKGEQRNNIFTQYISVLTIGIPSMSLQDCLDLTLFQLFDLVERFQMYISWDIDIKARLAGASGDGKLEDWMKNIH